MFRSTQFVQCFRGLSSRDLIPLRSCSDNVLCMSVVWHVYHVSSPFQKHPSNPVTELY